MPFAVAATFAAQVWGCCCAGLGDAVMVDVAAMQGCLLSGGVHAALLPLSLPPGRGSCAGFAGRAAALWCPGCGTEDAWLQAALAMDWSDSPEHVESDSDVTEGQRL